MTDLTAILRRYKISKNQILTHQGILENKRKTSVQIAESTRNGNGSAGSI